jgi:hypothetical protein
LEVIKVNAKDLKTAYFNWLFKESWLSREKKRD